MMLDLPQPLGPTTPTSCPGNWNVVGSANDLKPESLIELSRTNRAGLAKGLIHKGKIAGMSGGEAAG
jgi:hypothetical protein